MKAEDLEKKWSGLNHAPVVGAYSTIRVAADCIPALFIGYNDESSRCLILSLPEKNLVDIIGEHKEYISIEYFDESMHVIIRLKNDNFYDLFNDLIISLYQRIKSIVSPGEAASQFILFYHKWSEFFTNPQSSILSLDEVKGLFGELFILRNLLDHSSAASINEVLSSWVGPYNKGHDFVHDFFDVEVKTKITTKADVKISSEFQLDPDFDKGLYLTVVSVDLNTENSGSIRDLVAEIRDLVILKFGDESIFLRALNQKNLTINNLKDYDNFRFEVKSIVRYDCKNDDFPKLTVKNIAPELSKLTYTLRVSSLDSFITESINY